MTRSKNRIYIILFLSCLVGYLWLFANYQTSSSKPEMEVGVCLIKHITDIPCPSCGSTRSILLLLKGNISEAFFWNPIGIFLFLVMIISPIWIFYDKLFHKESLIVFYNRMEATLRKKMVYIPAIVFVLVNWAWNIYKGL